MKLLFLKNSKQMIVPRFSYFTWLGSENLQNLVDFILRFLSTLTSPISFSDQINMAVTLLSIFSQEWRQRHRPQSRQGQCDRSDPFQNSPYIMWVQSRKDRAAKAGEQLASLPRMIVQSQENNIYIKITVFLPELLLDFGDTGGASDQHDLINILLCHFYQR